MGVGAGLYMYGVVVKKFTFAISSPDEFLFNFNTEPRYNLTESFTMLEIVIEFVIEIVTDFSDRAVLVLKKNYG